MNVDEIKALIQLFEASSLSELSLQREGARLVLKRVHDGGQAITASLAPSPAPQAQPSAPGPKSPEPDRVPAPAPTGHLITSPLVGTFYRRPSPGEPAYVEVGRQVKAGDTLCIVEAMKVMNEIKSDIAGSVRQVLVEEGKIVEYGQPLIALAPL